MYKKNSFLSMILIFLLTSCINKKYVRENNGENILFSYGNQIEKDILNGIMKHQFVDNAEIFYFNEDDDDFFFHDVKVFLKNGDIILFSNVSRKLKFKNKTGGILKINGLSFETKSTFSWDPNAMHVKELSILLQKDIFTVLDVLDYYAEICTIADSFAVSERWNNFTEMPMSIKNDDTRGGFHKKGFIKFELLKYPAPDFFCHP